MALFLNLMVRLVICGNMDFGFVHQSLAPVFSFPIIHLLLFYAHSSNCCVHHVKISIEFLHGDLRREVYMEIPKFLEGAPERHVCRLLKCLYCLREAR